jgi:4,5-dihydroxyphthalate decarboxylase
VPPPVELATLLGDYPATAALKSGAIASPAVRLAFAPVRRPAHAFKNVVRNLEFDVAELAIMTFLAAKAHGKPLVLLPAVVLARYQHPYLVYNTERGPLAPQDLPGKRVGIRAYSVTTATWVRGILADEFGVDTSRIRWITFEEPHVAEFQDPPNVERAPAGKVVEAMLLAGELDAAVLASPKLPDPRLARLVPDADGAAHAWGARHHAIQVNHMIAVKSSLSQAQPEVVREVYRMLKASREQSGEPHTPIDFTPFGFERNRRNVEVALDCAWRHGILATRLRVDDLFDDVTRNLD